MRSFTVGQASIFRVEEMTINSSMALLTDDEEILKANQHWLVPSFMSEDGQREFVFQSWILIVDSKVIVIDPCNGNDRDHVVPIFDHLKTPYIERFSATGIKPEQVDFVFCTHLHHDHCGWCTHLRDGKFIPTFPNARYIYVSREYERWDPKRNGYKPTDYNEGVFQQSVLPIMEAGLGELVGDYHRISSSVSIQPAPGHTLGHSILELDSDDKKAYFAGDVFHHPLQITYPDLHLPGCDDLPLAISTRQKIANLCVDQNALLIPAHFAKPHVGYVRREKGGLLFEAKDFS